MMANLSDVPGVPTKLDQQLRSLLLSLREHVRQLRGYDGDKEARAVTLADLQTAVGTTIVVTNPGGGGGGSTPDYTPPPTPTGCVVVAGIDFLAYQTDAPTFTQGNGYARTRVYGAKWPTAQVDPPTRANAVLIDEFVGQVGSMPTDPATRWCVWLAWVTRDGVESSAAAGGTNGLQATTGQDVTPLLAALAGKVKNEQLDPASNFIFRANLFTIAPAAGGLPNILPFSVLTTPTMTPAGELLPAGTYIDAAYIRNLEAALGRFQNAFITNAMIVSVSASRITSGVISVGNYIQSSNYVPGVSGWRIHGDGSAELAAASIRGKVTANQIDGKGLEIRDNAGNLILGAGNALALGYVPAGALNSNVGGVNLAYGSQLSGSAGPGEYGKGLGILYDYVGGYNPFGIKAGDVFTISAEVWQDGASAAAGQIAVLYLYCANSVGTWVAQAAVSGAGQTSVGARSSATLTVHPDTVIIGWAVYHQLGSTNTVGTALADRVQVERGSVATQYKPGVEPGATRGATFGVNIGGQITPGNASTYIANAAIGAAQIGSLSVGVMSTAINGGSGVGVQLAGQRISVLDDSAVRRIRIGYLF